METQKKISKEHITPNVAFIYYDNKLTGTVDDPYADEIVMVRSRKGDEDVTMYLTYDAILHFMSRGCESGQLLLKKDVMKARDIMLNIWRKATGGQSEDDKLIWMEPPYDFWMFPQPKSYVIDDLMSRGPKKMRVCCDDPNLDDDARNATFWDIVFNDDSYELYAQYWLR